MMTSALKWKLEQATLYHIKCLNPIHPWWAGNLPLRFLSSFSKNRARLIKYNDFSSKAKTYLWLKS